MARNDGVARDMGPEIPKPPCSYGNAGGTKDGWDDSSPLGKASDAGMDGASLSYEDSRGPENPR